MHRTLYWKRLLIVAAVVVAFGGAVFAVHHVQFKNQVSIFKTRAEQAEAEIGGDPAKRGEVIDLYAKYLKFRPADEGAYQRYAHLLLEQVKAQPATARATAAGVEGFLRAFPAHTGERRELAELYSAGGKHLNARQHLDMLFDAPGDKFRTDVEVLELAAECERGLGDLPKALAHLNAAVATGRAPVRVYKRALELNYANTGDARRTAAIDAILRTLIEDSRFKDDLTARVAAAQFQRFLGTGYMQDARKNIAVALKLPGGADDPETLLAAAEIEVAEIKTLDQLPVQLKKAEDYLRTAHARDPKHVGAGALLAEVLTRQGKKEEGVAVLRATAKNLGKVDSDYAMIADRLIDLGDRTESAAMIDALAADEAHKALAPYLRGRLALLKSDWLEAKRLLEEAAPRVSGVRTFHKKAMVGLAACYASMQNPDRQLAYCQAALRDDPNYPLALVGEAEALAKMGKVDAALRGYRRIVNEFQLTDYRPELARLELLDVLVRPVEAKLRDWTRFEESLGLPKDARPPEILILEADSLVARGNAAAGVKRLRDWVVANPKHAKAPAVYVALARLGAGDTAESALKVLDEAQAAVGDAVDVRLARASLLAARGKAPAPAEFDALGAGADKFPTPDPFRLWFGLGTAAGRVADLLPDGDGGKAMRAAALRYLRSAADLDPDDLTSRAVLLDHALAAGQADAVARALREIAEVEGPNGPVGAMGQIAVRLPVARKLTDAGAKAAEVKALRALAERARDSRPGWGRVYVALAHLDEMDGLNDAALANYRAAIDKGERQEFVIRRAVDLYRARKQDDQAVGMLNKLSTEVRLPDDLERYRAIRDLMLSAELPRNARATIDRIAPADSKDYRLQLLRGALLVTTRDDDGALAAFGRAVELNDRSPETWASLVGQLVRVNKPDAAKRAVAQAEAALLKAPPAGAEAQAELRVGLGGLHEMVGDGTAALAHFQAAAAADPLGLNPTRQLIQFYQRSGQPGKAEELLRAATASAAPDVARWARRHLALVLMGRSDAYLARGDALALIEQNLKAAADDPEDVKARAVVWTVDPATREQGVDVLRTYAARGELTPDEFYLLGRLAFDQGKFELAEGYFKQAARVRPGVTAEHLAAAVRVQLALNRPVLADGALDRLKANNPNSWEAVREEARLLAYKSKKAAEVADAAGAKKLLDRAGAVVRAFPGWDAPTTLAARSGPLLEEIGLTADAEAAYTKAFAAGSSPAAHQPLAVLHIRQKQPEKAIALAFEYAEKAPVLLTARLLTGAVRAKRPDAATEAKVEKWLAAALAKAATNPELEAALIGARAELHDARGEYDEAIKDYERSVAMFNRIPRPQSRNDVVVNNLCMLLALKQPERADDAVKMMSDLIAVRGPVPAFLDTRAVAYLVSTRPGLAIKDLEMALVQYDRAAYHFHLAWAMDLDPLEAKRRFAAKELQTAKRLGLTADDLHPIELEKYRTLLNKNALPLD